MKEKIINAIFTEYGDAIKAYQAAYNKADAEEKAARNELFATPEGLKAIFKDETLNFISAMTSYHTKEIIFVFFTAAT